MQFTTLRMQSTCTYCSMVDIFNTKHSNEKRSCFNTTTQTNKKQAFYNLLLTPTRMKEDLNLTHCHWKLINSTNYYNYNTVIVLTLFTKIKLSIQHINNISLWRVPHTQYQPVVTIQDIHPYSCELSAGNSYPQISFLFSKQ